MNISYENVKTVNIESFFIEDIETLEIVWEKPMRATDYRLLEINVKQGVYAIFSNYRLQIKDLYTDEMLAESEMFSDRIDSLAFSPDGGSLAVGYDWGDIALWDFNKTQMSFIGKNFNSFNILFNQKGSLLAVAEYSGGVAILNIATGEKVAEFSTEKKILGVGFSNEEELIVVVEDSFEFWVWNGRDGQSLGFQPLTPKFLTLSEWKGLSIHEKSSFLTALGNQALLLWTPANPPIVLSFSSSRNPGFGAAYDPASDIVAFSAGYGAEIWKVGDERLLAEVVNGYGFPFRMFYLPHANSFVWSLISGPGIIEDASIQFYSLDTGIVSNMLTGHTMEDHLSLAISPDGRILATGSSDGTIRLWQLP